MKLSLSLSLSYPALTLALDTRIELSGITALYGHSGAGKTSLLRWIAGLENGRGQLHFGHECWQDDQQYRPAHRRGIGFVFQDARLFPHLSVAGNLEYAWKRRSDSGGLSQQEVIEQLQLSELLTQPVTALSAGQQQRVAIARAVLSHPRLLLMDEPLANLDQASRQQILPMLESLARSASVPIIYVSHQLEEVCRLADQLLVLQQGKLIASGPTIELLSRTDLPLAHEDSASSIISARVDQHDPEYGLSELLTDNQQRLHVTGTQAPIGTTLRVRIPARDVSLTLSPSTDSSILNILPCTIDRLEYSHDGRVLARLSLGEQYLLACLTKKSADRLQLTEGQGVFAQVKTVALLNDY